MKILFNVMTLSKGGAERVINVLTNELVKNNDVKLVVNMFSPVEYKFNEKISINFLSKNTSKNRTIRRLSRFSLLKIIKLKRVVEKEKPDVIISFLPEPSLRLLIVKKIFKKSISCPVIISERNDPNIEYSSKLFNLVMRKLFPLADGFVFQTNDAMNYFKNIINCKQVIIMNPLDDAFVNYKKDFTYRKQKIVAVGRLEKQKNYLLLLESFKKFNEVNNDYTLEIYGSGSEKEKITNYISGNKLDNYIKLMGNVSNIIDYIKDASLFVMSSDYEGLPNALMEAMALGIPCISTDCPCGGPRMLIKNGENGILVSTNNLCEMQDAIAKVLSDSSFQDRISKESIKIRKSLGKDIIVKEWLKFIKSVIDKEEKRI